MKTGSAAMNSGESSVGRGRRWCSGGVGRRSVGSGVGSGERRGRWRAAAARCGQGGGDASADDGEICSSGATTRSGGGGENRTQGSLSGLLKGQVRAVAWGRGHVGRGGHDDGGDAVAKSRARGRAARAMWAGWAVAWLTTGPAQSAEVF